MDMTNAHLLTATRFMYWFTFFGVALAWGFVIYIKHRREGDVLHWSNWSATDVTILGAFIDGISISIQQWFWWVAEHLKDVGNCASHDPLIYNADACARWSNWVANDWVNIPLYFIGVFGGALIVNGIIKQLLDQIRLGWSKFWLYVGTAIAGIIWMTGYALVVFEVGV